MNDSIFQKIFGTPTGGLLLIANSFIFGFVLYYIIRQLLSYLLYIRNESSSSFIFRLIFIVIIINGSYFICEQILTLNSFLSTAIRQTGEALLNKNICFAELVSELNSTIYLPGAEFNLFSFDGLIKGFITIQLFSLVFSYSLRYVIIKIFILSFPFALLSLINLNTSWFFKSWVRSFISLLLTQTGISLVLLFLFSISYNGSDLISKLIYIGGIYALSKINSYIAHITSGISTQVNSNPSILKSFLKK